MGNSVASEIANFRAEVSTALSTFISANAAELHLVSDDFDLVENELQTFLAGGKRLRPLFALAGFKSISVDIPDSAITAISALELIQASALIHDDLMDASATRRGRPTIHERFAGLHLSQNWQGDATSFGASSAILIGNLCLVWADKMLYESGCSDDSITAAKEYFDKLRVEVMAGQFLDVIEQNRRSANIKAIQNIVTFKTSKYTVERPLHFGAALAGAPLQVIETLSNFAQPIGEAFQYRDDLLGAFGDPTITGKPVGDDFREGKRTLLVALFHERAEHADWMWFESILGKASISEDEVKQAQSLLIDSGVVAEVESKIETLYRGAQTVLENSDLSTNSKTLLSELSKSALYRTK